MNQCTIVVCISIFSDIHIFFLHFPYQGLKLKIMLTALLNDLIKNIFIESLKLAFFAHSEIFH
uniref:Partner of sld5 n=1 Tax=Rhizophora mucronata TaxID=61149 RepID=A0A2P2J9P3_RHIMU